MKLRKWLKLIKFFQKDGVVLLKKFEKNFERIGSNHWSDISNVWCKGRIDRIKVVLALLLFSMPIKVKEALSKRLSGNKITWSETFVRSKKFAKWKTILNRGTLAYYENLRIKTHLKKRAIFFVWKHNPPYPQISRFRSLHHLSLNNLENTNHRHLPLAGTDHCNSRLSENLLF